MDTDPTLVDSPNTFVTPPSSDQPDQPDQHDLPDLPNSSYSSSNHVSLPRDYPSLYDSQTSTVVAILLGMVIVGSIQIVVWQIYKNAKSDYRALTQFVTMMVGLVLGAYMADLLIAGPDTSLLSDDEHTVILGFVKDICLMVFSYYFGTRSNGGKPEVE